MDDLLDKLKNGTEKYWRYPMTPEDAAALIVSTLLGDLPVDRQQQVEMAINEWGSEWGSAVSGTVYESCGG